MNKDLDYKENNFTEEEEIQAVLNSIKFYENKYGGKFDEVYHKIINDDNNITHKDKACLNEWKYLMSIIK